MRQLLKVRKSYSFEHGFRKLSLTRRGLPALLAGALLFVVWAMWVKPAQAATRTWDGGGGDNNWSTCANWSTDTCPVAGDTVTFDGTSTKDSTVDASFAGTVTTITINAGYTGTITLARSLTVSSNFIQSSGIFTAAAQTLDINNSFTLNSGANFTASSGVTSVAGGFTINSGATFNANSGTMTFDGASSNTLSCNNVTFNLVVLASTNNTKTIGANCSLPLGANPTVTRGFILNGTVTGSGTLTIPTGPILTLNAGSVFSGFDGLVAPGLTMDNVTYNFGSYTTFDINAAFTLQNGANFTAPSGTMNVSGNFTLNSGTAFNSNNGTLTFDGGTAALACNNAVFHLVVFAHGSGSGSNAPKTVGSDCTLPLGANPTIGGLRNGDLILNGTITGSGTITTIVNNNNGDLTVNSTGVISGFSGLIINGNLTVDGATLDLSSYNPLTVVSTFTAQNGANFTAPTGTMTVGSAFLIDNSTYAGVGETLLDINGAFTLQNGANFTAPSGIMTAANNFTINSGTTFNANGGTVTFDGGNATLACNNATFNLITFAHGVSTTKTVNDDCNLPLGANPVIGATAQTSIILKGTLSGTGLLAMNPSGNSGGLTLNSGYGLSGFSGIKVNGTLTVTGTALNAGSYSTFDINAAFTLQSGASFTAPSGTMTVAGNFTINDTSTFNANGGTVTFDGSSNMTLTCDNATFNTVNLAYTGTMTMTVNSDCNLPLGNNPSLGIGNGNQKMVLNGTLAGTGTLTFTGQGVQTLNSTAVLSGFSGLVNSNSNSQFIVDGTNLNLGGYTSVSFAKSLTLQNGAMLTAPSGTMTVNGAFVVDNSTFASGNITSLDLNSAFTLQNSANFTAPSGTMTVAGNFTINSGTTFNANGGTVTFDGGNATLACNSATFNLVTIHKTASNNTTTVNSDCNLPLGSDPSVILAANSQMVLNGTLSGTGSLTTDNNVTLTSTYSLVGFNSLEVGGDFVLDGVTLDLSGYSSLNVHNGAFNLENGTVFTAPSATTHLLADLIISPGTTFNANGGTVSFEGTNQSIDCPTFSHVTFNSSGTKTLNNDCTLPLGNNPTFPTISTTHLATITGTGTLTASNLTLSSNISISGFSGLTANSLTIDGTSIDMGSFTTITLNQDFSIINGGEFTAPSGTLKIGHNFNASGGTFHANNGTVQFFVLYGEHQVYGDNTFYNLSLDFNGSCYGSISLIFEAGKTQTVTNDVNFRQNVSAGCDNFPVLLASTSPGTQWNIHPQGSVTANRVQVQDSNNLGSTINATSSFDLGNNTNWSIVRPPLVITTTVLPSAAVNQSYSQTIPTQDGIAPLTFTITSGSLPNGLNLNSSTGEISGTPTSLQTANFTVQVTDSNSGSASKALSISVVELKGKYLASDILGQLDGSNNPVFTANDYYSNDGSPSARGFSYPQGTVLDSEGHRLFVSTCGARVLEYDLDSNNNLLDRVADHVLGQPNLGSDTFTGSPGTNDTLACAIGSSYDSVHKRLFVVDDSRSRVLVYDLSNGITDGMPASHVLGQQNFTDSSCNRGNSDPTANTLCAPYGGSAYDPATNYFYLSDSSNARVLVFDLSNGITDGMDASYVIGQPDFATHPACCSVPLTQTNLVYAYAMALDTEHHRLFVGDWGNAGRVMVYDTNNLSNGMPASNVIGKNSFTDGTNHGALPNNIGGVSGLAYDRAHQRLFVSDDDFYRLLVFDLAGGISNGMDASAAIGAQNFTTDMSGPQQSCAPSQDLICDGEGQSDAFDPVRNRLYFTDSSNNRVLIYEFIQLVTSSLSGGTTGTGYSQGITTQHEQGTKVFSVTAGSLPPGIVLGASTGILSGTPTTAGNYSFTVTATDNLGGAGHFSDSKAYTLAIAQGAPTNSRTQTGSGASDTATPSAPLVLNGFDDFFSEAGHLIENLKPGDVLTFCLVKTSSCDDNETHTITVKNIDEANQTVTLTIASEPIDYTFDVNMPQRIDVDQDGKNDLLIELTGIGSQTASFRFRYLDEAASQKPEPVISTDNSQVPKPKSQSKLLWILAMLPLIAVITVIVLLRRRNKRNNNMPPPVVYPGSS
jgi:hypothetical protein